MRVEPHGVGSIIHITQRGVRGSEIVKDERDRLRFTQALFYMNDTYSDANWMRQPTPAEPFARPAHWPEREPLVEILGWTLLTNHFHLLVREIREGGSAKFMQRLNGSLSTYFNKKYKEKGSLFQGGYRGKTVGTDSYFSYLVFYVLIKNVLDLYPGGLVAAQKDFDNAWQWAKRYDGSSFRDSVGGTFLPIVDDPDGLVKSVIGVGDAFKQEAQELLSFHMEARGGDFKELMLESW